ncbi:MAG: Gfo/Idh/MocA family protein [Bacillota bacterium]
MVKRFRVGIIGLGAIGNRIAKAFAKHPASRVAVVCDIDPELADRMAFHLQADRWVTDYREMLEGDQVDLVYVAVPPRFHRQMALDIMEAGKHILCEKPLALTLDEAAEMAARARETGLVNAVNLPMHTSPGIRAFKEQLEGGYLGRFRRGELRLLFPKWPRDWQQNPWIGKREQGGPIREVGPHLFHAIMQFFGPIARVRAEMEYPADPEACEIGAYGALELTGGGVITVSCLCGIAREEEVSLTVYGTEGTLGLVRWERPVGARGTGPLEPLPADWDGWVSPVDLLARALQGEPVDLPTFESGLAIQRVLDAWERSAAASGRWMPVAR